MRLGIGILILLCGGGVGKTQPARNGQPVRNAPPPIVWPSPPLADGPIVLDTGIQHQIRLTVTKGFNQPWSMAFLPDGGVLVTERPGRLRLVRNGVLDPKPVAGVPEVRAQGLSGLMDVALHPRFAENHLVYFTLDFRFLDLLDNLPTSSDAFVHAGSKLMKTLRRSTPNG